jgi:CheY-like chemotaxis protein
MPQMTGAELVERLDVSDPHLSVLFTTGYSDEAVEKTLLDFERSILTKPYAPRELLQRTEKSSTYRNIRGCRRAPDDRVERTISRTALGPRQSLARSTYEPSAVITTILVPAVTKAGTMVRTPLERTAGL